MVSEAGRTSAGTRLWAQRLVWTACLWACACGAAPNAGVSGAVTDGAGADAALADDAAVLDTLSADTSAPDATSDDTLVADGAATDTDSGDDTAPDSLAVDAVSTDTPLVDADTENDATTPDVAPTDTLATDAEADVADSAAADAADATDIAAAPTCATAEECAGATPYCADGACVACLLSVQCPVVGAQCVGHVCTPPVACTSDVQCKSTDQVCDTSAKICRDCLVDTDCLAGGVCTFGQCTPKPPSCAAGAPCPLGTVCVADTCVQCGTSADCAPSQFCKQGLCFTDVCTPGSVCAGTDVQTCAADGSAWSTTVCGPSATCVAGSCAAIVCTPGATSCANGLLQTCSADGTALTGAACGANQTCVSGACVPVICTPGVSSCATGDLTVCTPDGTAWLPMPCGPGFVCAADTCQAQTCVPNATSCDGKLAQACDPLGLAVGVVADCGALGQFCLNGLCVAQLCPPGAAQCVDGVRQVCASDASGWVPAVCDDGNPCTTDGCNAATGACTSTATPDGGACDDGVACAVNDVCIGGVCAGTPNTCDDANDCTTDACVPATGACTHTPASGPCSDSNACTAGDTCSNGKCVVGADLVSTLAGATDVAGYKDGTGSVARFSQVPSLATASDGSVWIGDTYNNNLRRVTTSGVVTTTAGSTATTAGTQDGAALSAGFHSPAGIVWGAGGTLYIADSLNHKIRRIVSGQVSTFAGTGTGGYVDGAAGIAQFSQPTAVGIAGSTLYVADRGNNRIRAVAANGAVTTFAGTGAVGTQDGPAGSATFTLLSGLCVSPVGVVFVMDGNAIRRISNGVVDTLAGSATAGYAEGTGAKAAFRTPVDCAVDASGNVLVADQGNHRIRKITAAGVVTTLIGGGVPDGGGTWTAVDGTASTAILAWPRAVDVAPNGVVWIGDNAGLRRLVPSVTSCNDANPCTTDVCNTDTGTCTSTTVANGTGCDDGDACSSYDFCASGTCTGVPKDCNDGVTCTTDACTNGGCSHTSTCSGTDVCDPIQNKCIPSGCSLPWNACAGGSGTGEGCSNPYVIGRADAKSSNGYTWNGSTCSGADMMDSGNCYDEGNDDTFRIFLRAGESMKVTYSATSCSYFLYPNYGALVIRRAGYACADTSSCANSVMETCMDTGNTTYTAPSDGWYYLTADAYSSYSATGVDYTLNVRLLTGTCKSAGCECP